MEKQLVWKMLSDGAFVAGDHKTGQTAYCYPTSDLARKAKRYPERAAKQALAWSGYVGYPDIVAEYNARNWARLNEHQA